MRDLNYDLKQLCRRNRDGSYATQADREHILDLIADQLHEKGFRHMDAHSLKPKHVEQLVERWLAENLSPGTMKNRMTALRWWAASRTSLPGRMPPAPFRIASTSPTSQRRRNSTSARWNRFAMSSSNYRFACRPTSGYGARNRSRSSRSGRIGATASCSRSLGPRWP